MNLQVEGQTFYAPHKLFYTSRADTGSGRGVFSSETVNERLFCGSARFKGSARDALSDKTMGWAEMFSWGVILAIKDINASRCCGEMGQT